MYRDKNRQKQANRLRQARFKAKKAGQLTTPKEQDFSNTPESHTIVKQSNALPVTPSRVTPLVTPKGNALLDCLPAGVVRPDTEQFWSHSPEYKQSLHNLLTMSIEQLKSIGQYIPCWKYAQDKADLI